MYGVINSASSDGNKQTCIVFEIFVTFSEEKVLGGNKHLFVSGIYSCPFEAIIALHNITWRSLLIEEVVNVFYR